MKCSQCLMFVFNFLLLITGLLAIIAGVHLNSFYNEYENFIGFESFGSFSIVLIVVGCIIFLISFMGCCGALRESSSMVLMFSVFVIIILAAEVGSVVVAFFNHNELPDLLEGQFKKTLENFEKSKEVQDAWFIVQSEFECCGIKNSSDWREVFNNDTIPAACCHIRENCTMDNAYKEGCMPKMLNFIKKEALIFGIVGFTIFAVQIIGVIVACDLSIKFSKNHF